MRNKFFGNGEIHPGQKRVIHKVAVHVSPPPAPEIDVRLPATPLPDESLGELLGEVAEPPTPKAGVRLPATPLLDELLGEFPGEVAELPKGSSPTILKEPAVVEPEEIILTEPEISVPAVEEVILEEPPAKKYRGWRKKNSTV